MTRDGVAGLIFLALAIALWVLSRGLPQSALVPIGPDFYPRFVIGIMGFLSALLIVTDLLNSRKKASAEPQPAAAGETQRNYSLVGVSFAVFTLYVVLLPFAGYRIATFVFVAVLQAVFERPQGMRRWTTLLFAALVSALLTHVIFETYLSVLLPRGRWTGL